VVLTAVIDRSAYEVVDEAGATHQVARRRAPRSYTLSLADGGWRLTEVGSP
jgi:hypothetical protein